jgi:hypothetical protein
LFGTSVAVCITLVIVIGSPIEPVRVITCVVVNVDSVKRVDEDVAAEGELGFEELVLEEGSVDEDTGARTVGVGLVRARVEDGLPEELLA